MGNNGNRPNTNFAEHVNPVDDEHSLIRFSRVSDAIKNLKIVRHAFVQGGYGRLFTGDDHIGRPLRRFQLFGESSSYDDYFIEITPVIAGSVVSKSRPLNGAQSNEEQLQRHEYQTLIGPKGCAYRQIHFNDENAPINPQALIDDETFGTAARGRNALDAFVSSSASAARYVLRNM